MNNHEVYRAFMQDHEVLMDTTVQRLMDEYNRERKKLKIAKDKVYFKTYPVKTKTKNTWLIFMQKSPSVNFNGRDDIAYCPVVYYYDKYGLVVVRYSDQLKKMEAFWGHLFQRYNERMKLEMNNTIDVVKHFFSNCGYLHYLMYPSVDGERTIGICKDGFCFGETRHDDSWLVNKTFVSKDLAFDNQHQLEAAMVEQLKQKSFLDLTDKAFNEVKHQEQMDVLLSLRAK